MTFYFKHDGSAEQQKELMDIVISELISHFKDKALFDEAKLEKYRDNDSYYNGCFDSAGFNICSHARLYGEEAFRVGIVDLLFFQDLESAKAAMYNDIHSGNYTGLHDWISDVQENLSFVPEIKVV